MRLLPILVLSAGLAACASKGTVLVPAPGGQPVDVGATAAATQAEVRIEVDGSGWDAPQDLTQLAPPVRVTIHNDGDVPLAIRYQNFWLQGEATDQKHALPPMPVSDASVAGDVARPGSATTLASPPASASEAAVPGDAAGAGFATASPSPTATTSDPGAASAQAAFYVAPWFREQLPDQPVWSGPLESEEGFYATHYALWEGATPDRELVEQALPEGVLMPGGRIEGFLYFVRAGEVGAQVTFHAALENAYTGEAIGEIQLPFVVVGQSADFVETAPDDDVNDRSEGVNDRWDDENDR